MRPSGDWLLRLAWRWPKFSWPITELRKRKPIQPQMTVDTLHCCTYTDFFFLKFAGKFFRELVISSERGPSYPLEIAEWVSWCTDWLDRKYHYTALWTVVAELTKDSSSLVAWLWRQCFRWLKKFSSSSKLCLFWDYVTCKKNCSAGALFVFTLKELNILKIQLSKVVAPKKRFVMRQPFIWKTRTTRQEKPQERQTIRCMHWVSCSITRKDAWNLLETNEEMLNDVKIL